ncbi:Uncharacterised protein [Mycobacteroides abscessus subsp. abscessus]|nr:Uncharacterised protein [Mycobacteroides abscessus subsp. abscessus]
MTRRRGNQRLGNRSRFRLKEFGPVGAIGIQLDHFGCAHDEIGHIRRGAQDLHEPLGHRALVTQRAQVPRLVGQRLAHPAIGQQPGIRIGSIRQPIQKRWQQYGLNASPAPALLGQGGQVTEGVLRLLISQSRELAHRRLVGQPQGFLVELGDRFQQRLVEQLGVQTRHAQRLPLDLGAQYPERVVLSVWTHMRRPGQPSHGLGVLRRGQGVRALEPLQLQAVFQQPQKLIGCRQIGTVVTTDVSPSRQHAQRVDSRCHVQRLIGPAMYQLQQLHREFDVTQPAGAQFDLTLT